MVQGYSQKNSGSSGGRCSFGSNIGICAVFFFRSPLGQGGQSFSPCRTQKPEQCKGPRLFPVCSVELTLNNGMHILQKDLDYPSLYRLIPKLEGLVEYDGQNTWMLTTHIHKATQVIEAIYTRHSWTVALWAFRRWHLYCYVERSPYSLPVRLW